ncbi:hypothetical protein [Paraburkholderia sp. MM5384-R2]|uniref:hypothetical protein n=1 Tax=Paraburkholderia sp. MM5384-R2 TaxID=2723097 RepID=UPI001790BB44|nr:hypothetical protein [Paraburkholderia sp. MM5384-R2]MBB5502180.1 hypothetical protein [Paraburkholderia sp. MM5384-R2]
MANQSDPFGREEFWDDLLAFIEEGRVVPVVGQELLAIDRDGKTVPLYRAIAESLLDRYGLVAQPAGASPSSPASGCATGQVYLRPHQELNDAVCAVAASGRRVQDLYRPINDILRSVLRDQQIPPALRELARIRPFDLFATTTCDDLLARALNEVAILKGTFTMKFIVQWKGEPAMQQAAIERFIKTGGQPASLGALQSLKRWTPAQSQQW